mgnify:CR=1 FL=1
MVRVITIASIAVLTVSISMLAIAYMSHGNGLYPLATASTANNKIREYTLEVRETTIEISPGVRVNAWTYCMDGQCTVPGPVLRATEGDRVIVHLVNKSSLQHTIHFHGDHNEVNDGFFQEVKPGETYTYDFIAGRPGLYMYHCHIMPVTQHIRMGLYGVFIIDPKDNPLPPAREYVIVKGEYDRKDILTPDPEYVFFNGYVDQYMDHPLEAKVNELVRIYYVDLGATPAYGFHIHGTPFEVYPSGIVSNPKLTVQTWEVSPGNAAIIEAKWPWEGRYPIHLHGIPEEKGTMGYIEVKKPNDNDIDGIDIVKTKSISMIGKQWELIKQLQKEDPNGRPTPAEEGSSSSNNTSTSAEFVHTNKVIMAKGAHLKSSPKKFDPAAIQVNVGDVVTWINEDVQTHTVKFKDGSFFATVMPNQSTEFKFEKEGTYDYFCTLHPWMVGTVKVGGGSSSNDNSSNISKGSSEQQQQEEEKEKKLDLSFIAPPALQEISDDEVKRAIENGAPVHEFTLVALETTIKLPNGQKYSALTFNGTVPGPTLRVKQGDVVVVTLANAPTNQLIHSIDHHAATISAVPNFSSVEIGKTKSYAFIAKQPGVFMYHCEGQDGLGMDQHILSGMVGMVIVDPVEGYTDYTVDNYVYYNGKLKKEEINVKGMAKEFQLIFSELYINKDGEYDPEAMFRHEPTYTTINGLPFGYDPAISKTPGAVPLHVRVGDHVRFFVLNTGDMPVNFHIVGEQIDRVVYGNHEVGRGLQTYVIGSADGAILDVVFEKPGVYIAVNHDMAALHKGQVAVIIVDDIYGNNLLGYKGANPANAVPPPGQNSITQDTQPYYAGEPLKI